MKKFLLIVIAAFLVGCGKSSGPAGSSKDITIVFIPKITGNAFFESANRGAQEFAQRQGFTVRYEGSPEARIEDQIAIIEKAIADKADGICISSLDATGLDEVLKKALAAGIKVTTWDSDVSGDARMVMVSQGTPDQLGRMLVEMGAKSLAARGGNLEGPIRYLWHYSQATVTDQNSWRVAGEAYIKSAYPSWVNAAPENFYSEQNYEKAVRLGEEILTNFPKLDLIICNDSTALPGQAQAAINLERSAANITITGFASPNGMRDYCKQGIVERWGLWDCGTQGALGCYMAYYLASGKPLKVGSRIEVPEIGIVEVMPNSVLDSRSYTAPDSGTVLLPARLEFTVNNVDDYDF